MATFYYVAIANTNRKKTTGEIDSENEISARAELNKMGLSVLKISDQKIAESEKNNLIRFDFEGEEKSGKLVKGTIEAEDTEAAYLRLIEEFGFKINYVCGCEASPTEKRTARKKGAEKMVEEIIQKKEVEAAQKNKNPFLLTSKKPEEKHILRVKKTSIEESNSSEASQKKELDENSRAKTEDQNQKSSTPQKLKLSVSEEELEEKARSQKPDKNELEAQEKTPTFSPKEDSTKKTKAAETDDTTEKIEEEPKEKTDFLKKIKIPTKIQIPNFYKKDFLKKAKELALHSRNFSFQPNFWKILQHALGTLSFVFLSYFVVAALALRYNWGGLSVLAERTLSESTLLPFLAFSFLLFYLLTLATQKINTHRLVWGVTTFCGGGLILLAAGVNFLY